MDLLFKRDQKLGILRKVTFKLWGKVEFNEEETDLIKRYRFDKAVLIAVHQPKLFLRAFLATLFATIIASFYIFIVDPFLGHLVTQFLVYPLIEIAQFFEFYSLGYPSAPMLVAVLIGIAYGYWYFHKHRATIYVRDLMHGRYFACKSVIELARKEAWLETICAFLRQVMESAKHWDGETRFPIEALPKDEAKQIIIKGI